MEFQFYVWPSKSGLPTKGLTIWFIIGVNRRPLSLTNESKVMLKYTFGHSATEIVGQIENFTTLKGPVVKKNC